MASPSPPTAPFDVARFDVHRLGGTLVVDCQSDLLETLNTRFVIPLLPLSQAPTPARRLNPLFDIAGAEHVLVTQFASSVPVKDLGAPLASLADRAFAILDALDVLVSGV